MCASSPLVKWSSEFWHILSCGTRVCVYASPWIHTHTCVYLRSKKRVIHLTNLTNLARPPPPPSKARAGYASPMPGGAVDALAAGGCLLSSRISRRARYQMLGATLPVQSYGHCPFAWCAASWSISPGPCDHPWCHHTPAVRRGVHPCVCCLCVCAACLV